MAPEKGRQEGEPKGHKEAEKEPAVRAREALVESTARELTARPETARELAEKLGVPFMTFEEAKKSSHLVQNARGNFEPAPGYQWLDNPAKRPKHLRNWAVRKMEIDPKERARQKGLPFMTHNEAVSKGLIVRNAKSGNWEPAPDYQWIDYPKSSGNWAVRKKIPAAIPEPESKPTRPAKPPTVPRKKPAPRKALRKAKVKPAPVPTPTPRPAPKRTPESLEWPHCSPQLLDAVKLALDADGTPIPSDEEIDSIAETTYLSATQNYNNPDHAIADPVFINLIVNEIRFRELARQTTAEQDTAPDTSVYTHRPTTVSSHIEHPQISQEVATEKIDFDIDDLPELNNNGHVSIIIAGGRGRGEAGVAGGTGLFDGIKQVIYDPATNKIVIVDILRDIVEDGRKLNARTKNNMGKLQRVVEEMTGESTTYTVRLTLESMLELGDTMIRILGPITVDMEQNYVGFVGGKAILFPKHTVLRSGEELLHFAQFRKGLIVRDDYPHKESTTDVARSAAVKPYVISKASGGDRPRVTRQSLALKAIIGAFTRKMEGEKGLLASGVQWAFGKKTGFAVDNLGGIKDIYDVVSDNTNIGLTDMPAFLAMAKLFKRGGARIERIPGNMEDPSYYHRTVARAVPPNKYARKKLAFKTTDEQI